MKTYNRITVLEVEKNNYIVKLIGRREETNGKLNIIDSSLQVGYEATKKVNELIDQYNLSDETIISVVNLEYGNEETTIKEWRE